MAEFEMQHNFVISPSNECSRAGNRNVVPPCYQSQPNPTRPRPPPCHRICYEDDFYRATRPACSGCTSIWWQQETFASLISSHRDYSAGGASWEYQRQLRTIAQQRMKAVPDVIVAACHYIICINRIWS